MSYTNGLDKPTDYFNTVLWTGDGTSSRSITGVGFAPDMVWWKGRTTTFDHRLIDTLRTGTYPKLLYPNQNIAESEDVNNAESIDSDGFTVGSGNAVNQSGQTYVAWNWLAGGTASSNTDGDITSSVSANTTSGFSIVSYTGNGSATQTIGHGLGAVPKMMIFKRRNSSSDWIVYHNKLGATKYLSLNLTGAASAYEPYFANTEPTSSVFTVDTAGDINGSSDTFIAYCFAEKKGFSKFGSYTGTSSEVFIYTGFKSKFILIKKSSEAASWHLFDTSRTASNGGNQLNKILFPNLSNAEADDPYNYVDAYSNGFRCYSGPSGQGTETNKNGETFIYMCFAESPFVTSTGIPTTAR